MYMCISNVALGSKIAGYHDPRVLSERCLDVPLTALPPITYLMLVPDGQPIVLNTLARGLGFNLTRSGFAC